MYDGVCCHVLASGWLHLELDGAKPPISQAWGKATHLTRFLEFHSKPKEALPRTRRLLPHIIT